MSNALDKNKLQNRDILRVHIYDLRFYMPFFKFLCTTYYWTGTDTGKSIQIVYWHNLIGGLSVISA